LAYLRCPGAHLKRNSEAALTEEAINFMVDGTDAAARRWRPFHGEGEPDILRDLTKQIVLFVSGG